MQYRVGNRFATATHFVKVLECLVCKPPAVTFYTTSSVFNPSDKILLRADILGQMSGTYVWSCEAVEDTGDKTYGTVVLKSGTGGNVVTKLSGKFGGNKNVALKFRKGVLSSNVYYVFALTATTWSKEDPPKEIIASATYEIKTNGIPTTGLFQVTPSTGVALNTTFTMSAAGGWTDPDNDELQFEFSYTKDGKKNILRSAATDNSIAAQLPTGDNLTLTVKCIDTFGGFSEQSLLVTVTAPTIIDTASVQASFDQLVGEQNIGGFIVLASTFASTLTGMITDAEKALQMGMTSKMCEDTSSVETQDQKDQLNDGLAVTTKGASGNFNPIATQQVINALKFLLDVVETQTPATRRRRRRSAEPEPAPRVVVLKTPAQVETSLTIYSNLIDTSAYDDQAMNTKKEMRAALPSLTASMCKGFAVGEDAGIAENKLVNIQTLNKDFADVDTARIYLGSVPASSSSVVLGSILKEKYDSYSCGGDTSTCASACVSSWEMKEDLLSSSVNSDKRLSSIISIKLWDPVSQKELSLASGMVVDVVATATNNTYLCHTWDATRGMWVKDFVETQNAELDLSTAGASVQISCNVTKMTYLAVFEGPARVVTTTTSVPSTTGSVNGSAIQPSPSSSMSSTAVVAPVTTAATVSSVVVQFSFVYPKENCTRKLENDSATFTSSMQTQIADKAGVVANTLKNFTMSCNSIDIRFIVDKIEGGDSIANRVAKFRGLVSSGNMTIVIDGQTIQPDKTSFTETTVGTPTTAPTVAPVDDDDGLGAGAIVGIVIAVIAVIILIIVVVYVCCVKKNSRKQATVEPGEPSAMELKGRSNQAYTDYP